MKQYIAFLLLILGLSTQAQLRLPKYFSNDMILQRDQPARIWGWSKPADKITLSFENKNYVAVAGADSTWHITLPVKPAGGPYILSVTGGNEKFQISNVYFGDVYFCSGQSNMEFRMKSVANHDAELADADYPQIRQFEVGRATSIYPQKDVPKAQWLICNAKTLNKFSAVAFFFAKEIYKEKHIPIAIIHASWGGSPIETFMSAASLMQFPAAKRKISNISSQFISDTRAKNKQLTIADTTTTRPKGYLNVDNGYPTMVYNAMISPFFGYAVKGVLWYQGEANSTVPACYDYEKMLTNLVNSWRESWNNKKLPVLIVQLANYGKITVEPEASGWAVVQEAQRNVSQKLPEMAMAVTYDIGNAADIHPKNKQDVGKRLSASAFKVIYGNSKRVAQGPVVKSTTFKGNQAELLFDNIGSGIVIKGSGNQLNGFALAGTDHKFYRATAEVRGNRVFVKSKDVSQPVNLRYAFESSPESVNFYNKEGFPAVPFRTDELKDAVKRN